MGNGVKYILALGVFGETTKIKVHALNLTQPAGKDCFVTVRYLEDAT